MNRSTMIAAILTGLLAGLIASGSSEEAFAADLAFKPSEPLPPVVTPFDWSGPYLGLHAGFGWGREHDNQSRLFPPSGGDNGSGSGGDNDRFNLNGFVGGVHAGYNYQVNQFVFGAEGDFDYSDLKGKHGGAYNGGASPRALELKSQWQASLRARAGYAFDNLLLYATGGIAFADGKLTNSGSDAGAPIPTTSSSKTHVGWTVGLGAEYAFTPHWVGRAEVRYSDFNDKTYRTFDGPVKAGWDQTSGTLGISYKF